MRGSDHVRLCPFPVVASRLQTKAWQSLWTAVLLRVEEWNMVDDKVSLDASLRWWKLFRHWSRVCSVIVWINRICSKKVEKFKSAKITYSFKLQLVRVLTQVLTSRRSLRHMWYLDIDIIHILCKYDGFSTSRGPNGLLVVQSRSSARKCRKQIEGSSRWCSRSRKVWKDGISAEFCAIWVSILVVDFDQNWQQQKWQTCSRRASRCFRRYRIRLIEGIPGTQSTKSWKEK